MTEGRGKAREDSLVFCRSEESECERLPAALNVAASPVQSRLNVAREAERRWAPYK